MNDLHLYENILLLGRFRIVRIEIATHPFTDAIGREALARTYITGHNLHLTIQEGLVDKEWSVTLYHEVLEAVAVASERPPESVIDFIEADFERAGYEAHSQFGPASPGNLNRMLQSYGFRGH